MNKFTYALLFTIFICFVTSPVIAQDRDSGSITPIDLSQFGIDLGEGIDLNSRLPKCVSTISTPGVCPASGSVCISISQEQSAMNTLACNIRNQFSNLASDVVKKVKELEESVVEAINNASGVVTSTGEEQITALVNSNKTMRKLKETASVNSQTTKMQRIAAATNSLIAFDGTLEPLLKDGELTKDIVAEAQTGDIIAASFSPSPGNPFLRDIAKQGPESLIPLSGTAGPEQITNAMSGLQIVTGNTPPVDNFNVSNQVHELYKTASLYDNIATFEQLEVANRIVAKHIRTGHVMKFLTKWMVTKFTPTYTFTPLHGRYVAANYMLGTSGEAALSPIVSSEEMEEINNTLRQDTLRRISTLENPALPMGLAIAHGLVTDVQGEINELIENINLIKMALATESFQMPEDQIRQLAMHDEFESQGYTVADIYGEDYGKELARKVVAIVEEPFIPHLGHKKLAEIYGPSYEPMAMKVAASVLGPRRATQLAKLDITDDGVIFDKTTGVEYAFSQERSLGSVLDYLAANDTGEATYAAASNASQAFSAVTQ